MKAQMQKGFTLIELMIVVAIIGILAATGIPAYREYVATSYGGAAMKGVGSFLSKGQACIGTGIGCDTLTTDAGDAPDLTLDPTTFKEATEGKLVWKNDGCELTATISANGAVKYEIKAVAAATGSSAKATDAQCKKGANLD